MSGPTYVQTGDPLGSTYTGKTRYGQLPPYKGVLPYKSLTWDVLRNGVEHKINAAGAQSILMAGYNEAVTRATNKALGRFYGELREVTDLATALAERKSSISMIASRATQLRKAVQHIRKFKFAEAARTLGMGKPPRGVSRKKQFANNWLEFHFGWSPLVQDIRGACKVLGSERPPLRIRTTGSARVLSYSSNNSVDYPSPQRAWNYRFEATCAVGCRVISVNPDLMLANQLGFTSPQVVLWESVPFSFVVDWFSNVGDFLEQMTATIGFDLQMGYSTTKYHASGWDMVFRWMSGVDGSYKSSDSWSAKGFQVQRSKGIPLIALQMKPFKGFSPTRGLTAISLLLQSLKN